MNNSLMQALIDVVKEHVDETDDTQQIIAVARTVVHFGNEVSEEMLDEVSSRLD